MRTTTYESSTKSDTLALSVDNTPQANLRIDTYSGVGCLVNWGDGNLQILPSVSSITHVYATNYTGDVLVTPLGGYGDVSRFESTGSTAWNFDLGVFVPLTGLTTFYLNNLPNANITGSLNSFTGATGLINFYLYNILNANITGDSSAFANKTNIRDFLIYVSPTSNIVMDYDDILNIWQSSVYIIHRNSGISASKATTSPFNFDSLRVNAMYLRGIGLSTQSMDNMIIALDNSLVVQTSPKTIYLDQNAPHSGSPAVMTALSNLASKNVTVVL